MPQEITLDQRLVADRDTLAATADQELVFLSLSQSKYYGLDAVGTRFWQVLTTEPTLRLALEQLADEFEVDRETLERDLLALVEELVARGLAHLE